MELKLSWLKNGSMDSLRNAKVIYWQALCVSNISAEYNHSECAKTTITNVTKNIDLTNKSSFVVDNLHPGSSYWFIVRGNYNERPLESKVLIFQTAEFSKYLSMKL